MAATFGASALTDAFNVAFRIPNLFRRLFAEGAFSQAFVPVLADAKIKNGDAATRTLIDSVATVLTWALVLTCVLGVLGAPLLVWTLAGGLKQTAHGFDAAVLMTRWMFPYIAFMSLVALAAGVLNTWRHYAVPAATPALLNVAMIGAAVWGAPWFAEHDIEPIYAMAAGVMIGGVLQLLVQIPALHRVAAVPRIGLRWSAVRAAWQDSGVQNITRLMLPALLGVGVAQLSLIINTLIASYMRPGSVSWLSYADRLMDFPTGLLGVALGVVMTPRLASARAEEDSKQYSEILDWALRLVVVLAVPCSIALLVFAKPLVATLFHYGAFKVFDVTQVSLALMGYGTGLVGLIAIKVLAPGFYAQQDVRTPVRIALVVLVVTQLLNIALVPRLAHAGLALSIGLGALLNAGLLLVGLLRRGSYQPGSGWGVLLLQVTAAGALLAVFLSWASGAYQWLAPKPQALERATMLGLYVLGAAAVYFAALWLSGVRLRSFTKT